MKHSRDFNSFVNESKVSDKLVPLFVKAIEKVDASMSYYDLAATIATIIKEEYGTHNIKPFMNELQKQLDLNEATTTPNEEGAELKVISSGCGTDVGDSSTLSPNPGESEESFKLRTFSASVKDYENYFK
jgi:hypothetical protein